MLHIRILLITVSTISLVFGDDSVCTFGNDGDLADQLDAKDFYNDLSPFQKKVFDAVPSDGFFHKMFNVTFEPTNVKKVFFDQCIDYSAQMGLNCAINRCKIVAENSKKAVDNDLSELKYFIVVSNFLENSLKEEGQLHPDSEEDMIKEFLQNVGRFVYADGYEGAKGALTALVDGSVKFFRSIGVSCLKDIAYLSVAYGEQMEKAAKS